MEATTSHLPKTPMESGTTTTTVPARYVCLHVSIIIVPLSSPPQETTEERMVQESPYMLFYQLQGLDNYFDKFRASKHGKRQELGSTDDDREFEETLKSLRKACVIQ